MLKIYGLSGGSSQFERLFTQSEKLEPYHSNEFHEISQARGLRMFCSTYK